jgi:hypothetical protein
MILHVCGRKSNCEPIDQDGQAVCSDGSLRGDGFARYLAR